MALSPMMQPQWISREGLRGVNLAGGRLIAVPGDDGDRLVTRRCCRSRRDIFTGASSLLYLMPLTASKAPDMKLLEVLLDALAGRGADRQPAGRVIRRSDRPSAGRHREHRAHAPEVGVRQDRRQSAIAAREPAGDAGAAADG